MSMLTDFYRNKTKAGIDWISDIQERWTDEQWESNHEFIQWVFPLKTPSAFNPDAPILSDEDIEVFKDDKVLEAAFQKSVFRWLRFLGLQMKEIDEGDHCEPYSRFRTIVVKAKNFSEREAVWKQANHNWLRITRFITCMRLVGWSLDAKAVFQCLAELYNEGYGSEESFGYWQRAAEGAIG